MEKCKQPIFDKSWVNTEGQAAQLSHGTWYNVVNEDSIQLDNQYPGRFGNGNFDMVLSIFSVSPLQIFSKLLGPLLNVSAIVFR